MVGSVTPFNVQTFQRRSGRLVLAPLAAGGTAPASAAALADFNARRSAAPDGLSALLDPETAAVSMVYSVAVQGDYGAFLARVRAILAEHADGLSTALGGWLPLYEATRRYITGEVPLLSALAAFITLLVYLLSFASLRAVVLPLATICISLLWTFGLMSLAGVPLSMASLMLPPLIFALGSSYSIHLLHRYFSTARVRGREAAPNGAPSGRATLALRGVEVARATAGVSPDHRAGGAHHRGRVRQPAAERHAAPARIRAVRGPRHRDLRTGHHAALPGGAGASAAAHAAPA